MTKKTDDDPTQAGYEATMTLIDNLAGIVYGKEDGKEYYETTWHCRIPRKTWEEMKEHTEITVTIHQE